ncbi:putative Lysine decarboxylase transcriptional regulator, CadC [Candidatus Sulfotelmatobacter kueseliae]|uniref:Putative Lysine decarboxylase transcriptional regulator, CadC n=1 Tax=Candidatus Sulfotelmatobacter kueseliae TaxID=2042962 RepID=A0A2U3L2F5_9BACT|nr:putative Lysine decarboxylase transcriptional regulator, CadC [Candidatus Sulfotelmatobacter kueseliae]
MEAVSPTQAHRTLRFGVFEVDLRTAELRKYGVRIRLEEQPFHILALLLESPGELVTREDLRRKLWSADTFVDFDRSLNKSMSKLRLALGDSSENPRFIETLHRRGYRFIAPVHDHDENGVRPAAAHASDPDLQSPRQEPATTPSLAQAGARARWWLSWQAMVVVPVLSVAVAAAYYFLPRPNASVAPVVVPRRSVAVLGFRNLSGRSDQAWISTALSDWLTTELSAGEQLRTVPEESVARSRIELSLPDVDSLEKDSLARIGKNLNADYVVVGSYASLGKDSGDQVRMDLLLQGTRDGETMAAMSETGTEAHLFDLVSRAGEQLRAKLGVQAVTRREAAEVAVALPSNHDAARLYSEGLAKLRVFDALSARDSLQKAVAFEPDYAPSHSALATAWATLGYDENARIEARRAFELSANLPRAERLLVEGRYQEMSKNWEKAIDTYRALFAFFPDSLDYGLALAHAQVSAGKGKDALETVEALQKLPPPLNDDPRIDLAEARAAESLGDYKRDEASCVRAAAKAQASGASILFAEARTDEAWALSNLGQSDEAIRAAAESKQIYEATHDQRGVARAINFSGIALENKGDTVGAKRMYEQALATFRQIGNKLGVANELDDLGDVLLALGDLKGARQKYEESMAADQEIENPDGIALAEGALGVVLLATGDHEAAKKADQESVDLCRRIGDREKAAIGLAGLGNAVRMEGSLEQARKYESEAVAIFDEIGDKQSSNRFQLDLAELAIDEHDAASAEAIASRVADEFARENALRDESLANAVLSRALLEQGKTDDAKKAIDQAQGLAEKYHDREVEFFVAVTAARVRAAANTPAARTAAATRLQRVIAEATRTGFVTNALEARLALAEIEMISGNRSSGFAHLESLRKEAGDRGLGLIAQQAAAVMKRSS